MNAIQPLIRGSIFLAIGALAAACGGEYGDDCSLPEAENVNLACFPNEATGNSGVCVYVRSVDCNSNACATYNGGSAFCTEECDIDEDCGAGSSCEPIGAGDSAGYCVPESQL